MGSITKFVLTSSSRCNLVYLLKMDDFVLLIPQRLDFNKSNMALLSKRKPVFLSSVIQSLFSIFLQNDRNESEQSRRY